MAYTEPTNADLMARFPEFAAVDAGVIDTALIESAWAADTDESVWPNQVTFSLARMLVACHALSVDGHGTNEASGAKLSGFQRVQSGRVTIDRGNSNFAAEDLYMLKSSAYGKRYLELLRRNIPGILAVSLPT